jgi:polysaccharide export outer membrane protein
MKMWTQMLVVALVAMGVLALAHAQEPQGPVLGQTSSVDNQGIRNYLLGPGDVLDVRVFGEPNLSAVVEIDGDGAITSLPFLEAPIRAKCRTEKDVQKDIAAAYAKYLRNPQVSVRIQERKSRPPATVSGAVRASMQVQMMRRARLHELIAKAGGITEKASGTIQIVHTELEMCPEPGEVVQPTIASAITPMESTLELYKVNDLKMGKEQADPFIRPGDIIIVTEGDPVYVTGAVVQPRELVMKDQLTLGRAIAMAGGPVHMANTAEVHIYRQVDGKISQEDLKFSYDAIRRGRQEDVPLKPYDIVDVRASGAFSGKGIAEMLTNAARSAVGFAPQRAILY